MKKQKAAKIYYELIGKFDILWYWGYGESQSPSSLSENHNPEKGFWVTLGDTCFRKWLAIMS